jgi:formylglycine-generating enzyme required for sulfatase activity
VRAACDRSLTLSALTKLQHDARQWFAGASSTAKAPAVETAQPAQAGPAAIDLFLCYSHRDLRATRQVQESLRSAGLSAWLDEGLEPGAPDWQDAIAEAIAQATAMVVLLSPNAKASPWVRREISYAQAQGKRVFPLLLEGDQAGAVPLSLMDVQWVDGRDRLATAVAGQLLPALLRHLGRSASLPGPLRTPPLDIEWITVVAGPFLMGSDMSKDTQADADETPQHSVHLPEYLIASHPVTNAQYLQFVKAAGHQAPRHWTNGKIPAGKENHPVVQVTWHDACAWCVWASKLSGRSIRLPSEAEWEKASRGTDGRTYPWGNEPPDAARCNFGSQVDDTTPVGNYPGGASPYGVLDMAGNVWEWTRSVWGNYPYPADGTELAVRENLAAGDSARRVLRGGSYYYPSEGVRCAYRNRDYPLNWDAYLGFRVVASPFTSGL